MRRNARYLGYVGIAASLGLGAYLLFRENSDNINLFDVAPTSLPKESQTFKEPALTGNKTQSSRLKLEKRIENSSLNDSLCLIQNSG